MAYSNNLIGVSLTRRDARNTVTSSAKPMHAYGDITIGNNGNRALYVKAGEAITQYDALAVDENFTAKKLTRVLALVGHRIAWCQADDVVTNDSFWAVVEGPVTGRLTASVAADAALYIRTGSTAGVLDDLVTASGTLLNGVVAVSANATTGNANRGLFLTYPHVASV